MHILVVLYVLFIVATNYGMFYVWVLRNRTHSFMGDFFALLSALTDGLFSGQISFILFTFKRKCKRNNLFVFAVEKL